MVRGHGKAGWSHLFGGLIALGLGGAALFAAKKAVIHLEHATVLSEGTMMLRLIRDDCRLL